MSSARSSLPGRALGYLVAAADRDTGLNTGGPRRRSALYSNLLLMARFESAPKALSNLVKSDPIHRGYSDAAARRFRCDFFENLQQSLDMPFDAEFHRLGAGTPS